jgi:hypothetical protein
MVASACVAFAAGTGTAHAQLGDGSIGTVQVAPPPVDVSGSSVDVQPGAGTSQTADGSVGTVQVGGSGAQTATGSVGTAQVALPGTRASASSSPSANGTSVDPNTSFSASVDPAEGGGQSATDSIGTAQVGGGEQHAADSIGTAQVAQPGVEAEGSFTGPLRPGMPDGLVVLPEAELTAGVDPAEGGPQTASNSVGTVQVGGGEQHAGDSALTAQVAVPSVDASANGGGDDVTATTGSLSVTPAGGGPQTADGSVGTVQVGGGGDQTARDSLGTAQVAPPAIDAGGGVTDPSVSITPTGGDQTAENSVGTVQVGGGQGSFLSSSSPPTGSGVDATSASVPARAPAAATPADVTIETAATPRSAGPLGVLTPLTQTGRPVGVLPFTGVTLAGLVLLGLALVLFGVGLRRRAEVVA